MSMVFTRRTLSLTAMYGWIKAPRFTKHWFEKSQTMPRTCRTNETWSIKNRYANTKTATKVNMIFSKRNLKILWTVLCRFKRLIIKILVRFHRITYSRKTIPLSPMARQQMRTILTLISLFRVVHRGSLTRLCSLCWTWWPRNSSTNT